MNFNKLVVHEDNHLLVINKPAGMLAQEDETKDLDALTLAKRYIKQKYDKPGNVFLGLVHRLDRPASGLMVFARTSKAASRLSEQFRRNEVKKQYVALVEGTTSGKGKEEDYLLKDENGVRIVSKGTEGSKLARLSWRSIWNNDSRSILIVNLETGRPHQIRVQLAYRGFPIVGDFKYGAESELDGKNLALHSARLGLIHPTKKENMVWVCFPENWPKELVRILDDKLDIYNQI